MNAAPRHRSTYAWRARLGLIVPPTNTVNEAEWSRLMPEGVSFHTMRMPIHAPPSNDSERRRLVADIAARAAELTPARVDVVAYACTAGSMVSPPRLVGRDVAAAAGVAVVTTAAALVDGLAALGARRISVATPYHDALNRHEAEFLEACGFAVARIVGLGIGAGGPAEYPRIAETPIDAVAAHARAAFVPGSDALLISCTDFPTLGIVPLLERDLGVPVVTSNQATLWAALRAAGVADAVPGACRLLGL